MFFMHCINLMPNTMAKNTSEYTRFGVVLRKEEKRKMIFDELLLKFSN